MSDIIHLLSDSVANQIAAGEVIQRPASVIKELVENAIDAGATEIKIIIKDAGRTLIQVIDNGKGMSPTDARLAFERHATSKIKTADDLYALRTMGFRGEALASIAAIAQIELRSRRQEDEVGTMITIAASQVEKQEPVSCSVGSNFAVKNIFFNVPARRKFLKSNQTELSNILTEFERIALVNPDIAFILIHNDGELFNLPASNTRQRIIALFGKGMNQQLLTVEVSTSLITVSGYVGRPESARKRNALHYFFINGRYMRHPYFHKAVMQSYEQLIPVGEMPNYFLYMDADPASIDVNIHPTKTEIKFENEQPIWQIISAAVKETLGKFNAIPSIDFDMEDAPDIPVFSANQIPQMPKVEFNPSYNPFNSNVSADKYKSKRPDFEWSKLYDGFEKETGNSLVEQTEIRSSKINRLSADDITEGEQLEIKGLPVETNAFAGNSCIQMKGRYILSPVKSGMMIIDQTRAHVRILFDRYMSCISKKQGVSQRVLFPRMIQLPVSQAAILDGMIEDLDYLGFEIAPMGGNTFSVNAIPAGSEGLDAESIIQKMIETATEKGCDVKNDLHEAIALSLAENAAIPCGQVLSSLEMDQLIDDLFACSSPNFTPDGKPTLSILTNEEITKRFK